MAKEFDFEIMSNHRFSGLVEDYVFKTGAGYTEAVLHVADEYMVGVEDVPKLISKKIKSHIEIEATNNRTLKSEFRQSKKNSLNDLFG